MKFHSECGQDQFAFNIVDRIGPRTFLDIGCGYPVYCNNTYSLEQAGWSGWLVDKDSKFTDQCRGERKSRIFCLDACSMDWDSMLVKLQNVVGYLSLDVDEDTLSALKRIPFDSISFIAATIEHDAYKHGNGPRDEMRSIMISNGYVLHSPDVMCGGGPFEDWWINKTRLTT